MTDWQVSKGSEMLLVLKRSPAANEAERSEKSREMSDRSEEILSTSTRNVGALMQSSSEKVYCRYRVLSALQHQPETQR